MRTDHFGQPATVTPLPAPETVKTDHLSAPVEVRPLPPPPKRGPASIAAETVWLCVLAVLAASVGAGLALDSRPAHAAPCCASAKMAGR